VYQIRLAGPITEHDLVKEISISEKNLREIGPVFPQALFPGNRFSMLNGRSFKFFFCVNLLLEVILGSSLYSLVALGA
jgi:hypothetical protein